MSLHSLHFFLGRKVRTANRRRPRFEPLERRDMLATITVTNLADNLNVDGQVTLREAIRAAELDISVDGSVAGNGADVIQFDNGLSGVVDLVLTGDTTNGRSAFFVATDVVIQGNANGVTIQRSQLGPEMRLFRVAQTRRLTVEWLTLADGIVRGAAGEDSNGNGDDAQGGAIFNEGTLRVIASTIVGNTVHGGNAVGSGVGGVGSGGAIYNLGGDVLILNSTLSGNAAHSGVGSNVSSFGGALYSRNGDIEIYNSTITNNVAVAGRSVFMTAFGGAATAEVYSSIIAQADAPATSLDFLASPDTDGILTVVGANNLIRRQNDFESIAISSDDPKLGPLADNGGPTHSHALLPNSSAINQGSNPLELSTDQRGASHGRVKGGQSDIGSFEVQNINEPGLRGDYNRNGTVDAADYVVWRKTLGSNVVPFTGADDDGDGLVELHEYGIWRNDFGVPSEFSQLVMGTTAVQQNAADSSAKTNALMTSDLVVDRTGNLWSEAKTRVKAASGSPTAPAALRTPASLAVLADRVFESLAINRFPPSSKLWQAEPHETQSNDSMGIETEMLLLELSVSNSD